MNQNSPIKWPFLILFTLIGIADLAALSWYEAYRFFTKPLIMICLIGYFLWETKAVESKRPVYIFLFALIFAWLGDCFLLGTDYFIYGLLSFLIMQILYTKSFLIGRNYHGKRELFFALILLTFTICINSVLWPHVAAMRIPVIIYTLAIAVMSYVAYTRDFTQVGYQTIWIGTLFFVVSDSVLSINLFLGAVPLGGLIVMSTYIVAQYLITTGFVSYLLSDSTS
jgi:uncharacterized membrane protein YhhN